MAVLCIGEMLIDFIGEGIGSIDKIDSFKKEAGGCVANVACVASKLGHKSYLLTALGNDGFGKFLEDTLKSQNVSCDYLIKKDNLFTPLAFVSRDEKGDRSFSFYFKGSSALKISRKQVEKVNLDEIGIIHFASIAIQDESKESHKFLIERAKEKGILISFDVNLRFNLWEDMNEYYNTIQEFLPYVDILKISDNELEFVTGTNNIEKALEDKFKHISHVLYTKGENGSEVYHNGFKVLNTIPNVKVIDTTGAGDAFVGAYISKLLKTEEDKKKLSIINLENISRFATNYASLSTTNIGAISSYVDEEKYKEIFNKI